MIVVINLSWTCLTTVNEISRYLTIALAVELKVKAKNKHHAAIYNHTLATILVQYASAGFQILELIVDVQRCLQAFVGVAEDLNAIVIAFRGTQESRKTILLEVIIICYSLNPVNQMKVSKNFLTEGEVVTSMRYAIFGMPEVMPQIERLDQTNYDCWFITCESGAAEAAWIRILLLSVCYNFINGSKKNFTRAFSLQNWIEDLYWKQLDISYPGMEGAMVHHGFYSAYHNTSLRPGVLSAVKRAKDLYGNIQIIVTGHSMGGAMAAFCGLDLTRGKFHNSQNPLVLDFELHKSNDVLKCMEVVWLYDLGFGSLVYTVEKVCDNSGEDPSCSRSVSGNSIKDHLRYFGVKLSCDVSAGCRIVMDNNLAAYHTADSEGNIIFSRNISSVLRMNVESSEEGRSL
ncbi:putative chromatin-remodeling complex ATPase chain-like [Capsicum annuum]|nr:putative chromatin-remodeling complex ATPase chain-like [Capsicum annuum]